MQSSSRQALPLLCSTLLAFALCVPAAQSQVNVLTRHNDLTRAGVNRNETILTPATVGSNRFVKLYSRAVDGEIYAQPLYVSNLAIPNRGTRNVVFVATAHNSIYAFDADDPLVTQPYWQVSLGASVPSNVINTPNLPIEVGIISTPVIDLNAKILYAVAKTYESQQQIFRLHALDLTTGAEKPNSPVVISGDVSGNGDGNDGNGRIPFRADKQNQRPALTLYNNNLYIAFASHEDFSPYHGWVFRYNATTLQRLNIHCNTPNGGMGGIWMSGAGLPVDSNGNLYYAGGNGTYDGATNLGESVVKLRPDGSVADWFTPHNVDYLNSIDFDISSNAILVPERNYLITGGKEGVVYVLDTNNMGKFQTGGDTQIVQRLPATVGHIHSSMVFWNSPEHGATLYLWGERDRLRAFKMANNLFQSPPFMTSAMTVFPGYANGPGLALSANGNTRGSGVIWAYLPFDGDSVHRHVNGILRAFDAADITRELWNSRQNPERDDTGKWAKWCPPTVANGKVYLATFSNRLDVFGLLSENAPTVQLTKPVNREIVRSGSNVRLIAKAQAFGGNTLQRVDFYINGVKVATDASTPYEHLWECPADGVYTLSVSATDSANVTVFSAPSLIAVGRVGHGTAISVNFVGGGPNGDPQPLAATETAGVVPAQNWNNAFGVTGTLYFPTDEKGNLQSLFVTWNCDNTWSVPFTETAGNRRMMKGYIDTGNVNPTTVKVSGIPRLFIQWGYDVYVYADGDNGGARRWGTYTLANRTIRLLDDATNFNGIFREAADSAGNYMVFRDLRKSSFTLTATPGDSTDPYPRAPINAIQIVLRRNITHIGGG